MSKERELLQEALNWMLDLSDIYTDEGPEDDRLLLRLVDDINKIKELLAQPKKELKREPLSDDEIDLGYQDSPGNYYDLAFRDGVRFAEKYHKIGINNV